MMLGLAPASRTIAALALRRLFPPGPSLDRFWDSSDRTAQLAAWLAHDLGSSPGTQPELVYTYALFRDCGIPILLRRFPDYKDVLHEANATPNDSFTAVEAKRIPTNHAFIGSLMAQDWGLPETLTLAIRHHHDASAFMTGHPRVGGPSKYLIATVQLAEHLYQQASGMGYCNEWEKMRAASLAQLNVSEADLPALRLRATAVLDSIEPV
jgi:HD-like signal output (HDOD) protein